MKKCIILGNMNVITYKNIFPLIKKGILFLGCCPFYVKWFRVPDNYIIETKSVIIDGAVHIPVSTAVWFTNLRYDTPREFIKLTKTYNPVDYPKFDNYDAICVKRSSDIPYDYNGLMCVPISFLDKYNSAQFELVGEANHGLDNEFDLFKPILNNKECFKKLVIKLK